MEYQIQIGYVYKFTFKPLLSFYDGIYKVLSYLSIEEMRNIGVDLFKETFEPLSISQEDFNSEFEIFYTQQNSNIIKIQNVNDISKVVYIPEYYISKIPSINIKPYQRLGLTVNLGVFDDIEEISLIKQEINDILYTKVGISSNTIVFSVEEKWLTDDEYELIDQARQDNISNLSTIYSDNIELTKTISQLQSLINAYEDIILTLSET
jgi:hypothetical protein